MFSKCPKCDRDRLDFNGQCPTCGYSLKKRCSECGFFNIPGYRFCGGCGCPDSLLVNVSTRVQRYVCNSSWLKLKKFATGLSFGAVLSVFALFSTGMNPVVSPNLIGAGEVSSLRSGLSYISAGVEGKLLEIEKDSGRRAGIKDLKKVTDILLGAVAPAAKHINSNRYPSTDSSRYLRRLDLSKDSRVSRAEVAMVFYNILADFLEFNYHDFSEQSIYSDIPRHHIMSLPVTALYFLDIDISRSETVFGTDDFLDIKHLIDATRSVLLLADYRLKEEVFNSLAPVK